MVLSDKQPWPKKLFWFSNSESQENLDLYKHRKIRMLGETAKIRGFPSKKVQINHKLSLHYSWPTCSSTANSVLP